MKKIFTCSLLFFLVLAFIQCNNPTENSKIDKEEFVYSVRDGKKLYLDKYQISGLKDPKACIIFMFGGGFKSGTRKDNADYMKDLAKKGYVAIAIDYRLGMKDVKSSENGEASDSKMAEISEKMIKSMTMAIEDLYSATAFVCQNAKEWNIDPGKIVANGSSSGAISVLQGEYYLRINHPLKSILPDNFEYAGIIAFAGAVMTNSTELYFGTPAPMLLFHGDADANVPFNSVEYTSSDSKTFVLHGSASIADFLDKAGTPYWFYNYGNCNHSVSTIPVKHNLEDIDKFINYFILQKNNWTIRTILDNKENENIEKNFKMEDYLNKNRYL